MRIVTLLAFLTLVHHGMSYLLRRNGSELVPTSQRIVGGNATTIEEYPYMSNMHRLFHDIWWMQACGGVLLTPTCILSAAHCFSGDDVSTWRAYLGSSYSVANGTQHHISEFIIHPKFRNASVMDADIAIVKLKVAAILSNKIGTARIPGASFRLPDDTAVTAVGWGALWADGPLAEQLQHVNVNIINHALCADRYAYLKSQPGMHSWPDVEPGMVCAGILDEGGKDACQGDSGGPIVYERDIIYGISSWGYECAHPNYPGVFVRVTYYSDWIDAHTSRSPSIFNSPLSVYITVIFTITSTISICFGFLV